MAGKFYSWGQKLVWPGAVLLLMVAFTLAYFVLAHEGFYWLDDYGYAKYAWELKEGTFSVFQNSAAHPNNPLTHRLMVFAPVALFYQLFGLNIYAVTLWPLLCTLGCLGLIFKLFREENPTTAVFGLVLSGLYFHNLFLATYLYPDNILMFFAFASAVVLYRFRFRAKGQKPLYYAILFVLFNFLAFLSKETIVYYLPFYGWLLLIDLARKQHRLFWVYSAISGILLLFAYFGFYHYHTGNWFFRFNIIERTSSLYLADLQVLQPANLLKRLTYQPLQFFTGSGILVSFVLALGLLFNLKRKEFLKLILPEYFWLALALIVILQFWLGSVSIVNYIPITLQPRMLAIAMPPLCVAAAYGLGRAFAGNRKLLFFYAFSFLGAAAYAYKSNVLLMYAPLGLFFGWAWFQSRQPDLRVSVGLCLVVLTLILSLRPLHFMRKPSLMAFPEQEAIIEKHLSGKQGKNLIITDPWLHFTHDYYYQFQKSPHYVYQKYADATTDFKAFDSVFLLINRRSLQNPDMKKWQTIPEKALLQKYAKRTLVTQKGDVTLYRLK